MNYKLMILLCCMLPAVKHGNCQNCDCDIFPIKEQCKQPCGLQLLQTGTAQQLKTYLKIDQETAGLIIKSPQRSSGRSLEDFKTLLPAKNYNYLKIKFTSWLSTKNIQQNNQQGDNVAGNKIVTNNNYGTPDTKKAERNEFLRPEMKGTWYCVTSLGILDEDQNIQMGVTFESVGAKGRAVAISDTTNATHYKFTMYVNPVKGQFSNGKKTVVFDAGDVVKFIIGYKNPSETFDVYFLDAAGNKYYQRARWKEGTCGTYQLSPPVSVE